MNYVKVISNKNNESFENKNNDEHVDDYVREDRENVEDCVNQHLQGFLFFKKAENSTDTEGS
jgi:hypothetical protein